MISEDHAALYDTPELSPAKAMSRILYYLSGFSLLHAKTKSLFIFGALCVALVLITTGCDKRPLPEADSPSAMLYAAKCGICHPLRNPEVHTYTGWVRTIPIMEKRAAEMGMKHLLTKEEKTIILGYMKKHARKGF